jgi:negative regulator of flagellin synthesis FlgM
MSYEIGIGDLHQAISPMVPSEATAPIQTKESNDATDGTKPGIDNADQTDLSFIGGLVAQALGNSDTRTEKVASLQQTISAGQYSVSSSDVADRILQSLQE